MTQTWDNKWAGATSGSGDGSSEANRNNLVNQVTVAAIADDYIWVYRNAVLNRSAVMTIAAGGVLNSSTRIAYHGYKTLGEYGDAENGVFETDMDYGRSFYQSPLDALINGIDESSGILIDGGGGSFHMFDNAGMDCLIFRNFIFRDLDTTGNYYIFNHTSTPEQIWFINCKFDDVKRGVYGATRNIYFVNCYINCTEAGVYYIGNAVFNNCVFNIASGQEGIYNSVLNGTLGVYNCLFIGGNYGVSILGTFPEPSYANVHNCTFYNQTSACIRGGTHGLYNAYNNIFMPAAISDYGIDAISIISDYNIFWSIADAALTNPLSASQEIGNNSLEKNPQLIIKSGAPIGLKANSPCRGVGLNGANIGWKPPGYMIPYGLMRGKL